MTASREIYGLESGILESQHLKSIGNLLRGPPALNRVAAVALDEVKKESKLEVDPLAPRAQRQLLLFRQAQLVSRLRSEHETVLMMLEEGQARTLEFRRDRNWILNETLQYMQRTEAALVSQKDKLAIRNPGFAATMVQSLHLWGSAGEVDDSPKKTALQSGSKLSGGLSVDSRSLLTDQSLSSSDIGVPKEILLQRALRDRNRQIWAAQNRILELLGRDVTTIGDEGLSVHAEHLGLPLDGRPPDLLQLLCLLQVAEVACHTAMHARPGGGADKGIAPGTVLACAKLVAQSLVWLRDWSAEGEADVAMLLQQALRSLKMLLGLPPAVARLSSTQDTLKERAMQDAIEREHKLSQRRAADGSIALERDLGGKHKALPWTWGVQGFDEDALLEHLRHWLVLVWSVRKCRPRSDRGRRFVQDLLVRPGAHVSPHQSPPASPIGVGLGESMSTVSLGMAGPEGLGGFHAGNLSIEETEGDASTILHGGPSVDDSFTALTDPDADLQSRAWGGGSMKRSNAHAFIPPQPHDSVWLGSAVTLGSPLLTDLLLCCSSAVQAALSAPAPPPRVPLGWEGVMNPFDRRRMAADDALAQTRALPRGAIPHTRYYSLLPIMTAGSTLALSILYQYQFLLNGAAALNFDASDTVTAADEEAVAALRVLTSCFSSGILLPAAVKGLVEAEAFSRSRLTSYFVQIAYLQMLQAALSAYLQHAATLPEIDSTQEEAVAARNAVYIEVAAAEREKARALLGGLVLDDEDPIPLKLETYAPPPDPYAGLDAAVTDAPSDAGEVSESIASSGPRKKDRAPPPPVPATLRETMCSALGFDLANHIILIMSVHRQALTVQQAGLLSLRLLLREPLMKRAVLSNLMEIDEFDKVDLGEQREDQEFEDDEAREAASVHTSFTAWRGQLWERERFREEETGRDVQHFMLTQALIHIGDSHLQSVEVAEQMLLLMDHLTRSTYVCKLALGEAGMSRYASRVMSLYPSNLYLAALAGIVLDQLKEEE